MEQMTVKDIVLATGGRLLCGSEDAEIRSISIDSRNVPAGALFVPLVGEKTDAHRFIGQAFDLGAAASLTSEHDEMEDHRPWIRVEDTRKALQAIGRYYRERLTLPLIGVTGSVGKTTTREMIAAALSAGFRVFKTSENHNSQVGVPITVTEIAAEDEIGVLELGISLPGEMPVIAGIAQVDMAVVTNIGTAHIEQLGSRENTMREKLRIQDGMKKGGILFLNGDDPLLREQKARSGCRTVYYGMGETCDYRAVEMSLVDGYPTFTADCRGRRIPVRLGVAGEHNVTNAMAALAVADAYGVDLNAAVQRLSSFHGYKNRQQIFESRGITVIDDTYNASPASMLAALKVLLSMERPGRRAAALADMKELGPESGRFHREIGEWLAAHPVDLLVTYGDLALEIEKGAKAGNGAGEYRHYLPKEREALIADLPQLLKPGDCVLLKGSNSMKLAEVAAALR
ncbi:MAG: UDP-N-acetylmuramoyl-tripeptide--D-alanyl-D-alanine ligase [Clostridiales bacterium]|nr:UDP-N-acetylmuramoyl-tripeptide--D-alanyl-D-alanine ligase [Clostridiales bacterium]